MNADRVGSGRDGRASSGPTGERAGAAGSRDELRGCWSGAADRRRYDPDVAPAFRGRRGRWSGRIQLRGRACQLTLEQQVTRKAWVGDTLPRTTRMVGAWIEHEFEVVYESRSGLIALLHRLGLEHRKPEAVSRKLDPARQQAFIDAYE